MKLLLTAVMTGFLMLAIPSIASAEVSVSSVSTPQADLVLIDKSRRLMGLYRNKQLLRTFKIALGTSPIGDKNQQGDGRTPEGTYYIDRKNPNSKYHLSLGISYPNSNDVAEARARGVNPGGDIFIHGGPLKFRNPFKRDWTAGCISVSDSEIEEIWSMVQVGTLIVIQP